MQQSSKPADQSAAATIPRHCTCNCAQHPRSASEAYPTPPASPDLVETPHLLTIGIVKDVPAPILSPLPIPLLLDTPHKLPHASTFRLSSSVSILNALSGSRVFSLDSQTLWDRMPYPMSAAVVAVNGRNVEKGEEARVEQILGGKAEKKKPTTREHIRSIFVQPPTPERETPPSPSPIHLPPIPSAPIDPPAHHPVAAAASLIPLQVLPEVRSPPRRSLALAADSLQLNLRRGRRPRLFGFTEIPGSTSSSPASSANNSRSNSPERTGASPLGLSSLYDEAAARGAVAGEHAELAPGPGMTLPRRGPIRAKSETHLPTISNPVSPKPHSPRLRTADNSTHPPRKARDNGLKLDFTGIIPIPAHIDAAATYIPSPYSAKLIRKKSGELVKPALKYGGPLTASGTPLAERDNPLPDTPGATSPYPTRGSKSLPATPSFPKIVHFDSQLERVKLFNKDHKPQVVSRDGSPTQYTTSEGEEYPFPSTDDEGGRAKVPEKVLSIKLPNFPSSPNTHSDLQLESLQLDDAKNIRGIIVVRNFAFNKWVAVRFTFDWWQTTSEVSAVHKETIRDGAYDRFGFIIKLGDMMSKIEEKTLFMCVRYNSEGREVWDSNEGQNYQVNFERKAAEAASEMGRKVLNAWGSGRKDDDRLAGLREKLSRLTAEDDELNAPLSPNRSSFLSPGKRGVNFSFGGSPNGSPRKGFSSLPNTEHPQGVPNQLSARYDFGSAFKGVRAPSPDARAAELPAIRTGLLAFEEKDSPARPDRPGMDFYSPRYTPIGLPEPTFGSSAVDFFASPGKHMSDSPVPYSNSSSSSSRVDSPLPVPITKRLPSPLDVPGLTVQGPSPPPPESPIASISAAAASSPSRPALGRSQTSPAIITTPLPSRSPIIVSSASTNVKSHSSPLSRYAVLPASTADLDISRSPSPPMLGASGSSASSTENSDSPRSLDQPSPADVSLSRFAASRDKGSTDSIASYSSFIEQFCWGGGNSTTPTASTHSDIYASPTKPSPPRRIHSSSSLDEYFAHSSMSAAGSGFATPRAPLGQYSKLAPGSAGYFPSVPAPGARSRDAEDMDRGLISAAAARALGGGVGMGLSLSGSSSPPIMAGV